MGCSCLTINTCNCNCDCDCKAILTRILDIAGALCVKHASYVCFLGTNLDDLETCLDDLKLLKDNVMDLVTEAEKEEGMLRTRQVEEWFKKVATKRADARRLKEEGQQERRKLPCTMECLPIYIVGEKIVKIMKDLSDLKTDGERYKNQEEVVASGTQWSPEQNLRLEGAPEFTMVGDLEAVKKEVFGYLDGGKWIVGVYGQAGVGKTTLIRLIKDRYAEMEDFLVIHVPVRDLTVQQIQEAIRAEIRLFNDWKHESVEEGAQYISLVLQNREKFVLLLDDIREEFPVEKIIGVADPHRLKGSKVVFTTRNKKVSRNLAQEMVKVETLKGKHDRKLFEEAARLNMTSTDKNIIADAVVDFCAGLPLALVKLGKYLVEKTDKEWEDMISFLRNPAQHNVLANMLFQEMRYSYDNLEGEDYKECFLYCAFFPVGSYIRPYELEELWIYGDCSIHFKGFIHDPRARAREIIRTLVDAGLLEETKEEGVLKMHNVVRCMALWLASKDTLVMEGNKRTDSQKALEKQNLQGMKRLLSIRNKFEKLDKVPKGSCRDLTTLFVTNNEASSCKISDQFFTVMRMLTVLNLSNSKVEQLPTNISRLGSLKYLDISFTNVRTLPPLTYLYYLNVNGLKLEFESSKRVISTMSCLQVLRMLCEYGYLNKKKKKKKKKKKPSSRVGEEEDVLVEELTSLEHLDVLEIQVGSSSTFKKLFSVNNSKLLEKMRCLSLKDFKEKKMCYIYLSESTRYLVELLFTECAFLELRIMDPSPRRTRLNNITKVTVEECNYLLDLTYLVSLWGLKVLKVSNCSRLREIITRETLQKLLVVPVEGDVLFCSLAELHLERLPDLEFIYQCRYTGDLPESELKCPRSLPSKSLRELHVNSCKNLKKLPFGANSSRDDEAKQIQLHAPRTWWDSIDWKDNPPLSRHRFNFHPL